MAQWVRLALREMERRSVRAREKARRHTATGAAEGEKASGLFLHSMSGRRRTTALLLACAVAASCHGVGARTHPCAAVAATRSAAFASSCGLDAHARAAGGAVPTASALVAVHACVPLNASDAGFAARVDPLVRMYSPNAFVGRLAPAAAPQPPADDWEGVVALAFELEHEELVESGTTAFLCTRGVALGVPPGIYNYTVVHEFGGYAWDAPWDPDAPNPGAAQFGTSLVSLDARTPWLEPLPTTGEVLEVTHHDAPRALPDCGHGAMDGTWRAGRFVPFRCALRDVSGDHFERCMSRLNGTVMLLGDSNSRRAFKAVYGRSSWCPVADAAHEAWHCGCEDCGYECLAPENATMPRFLDVFAHAGAYIGLGVTNASDGAGASGASSKFLYVTMTGFHPGTFRAFAEERERAVGRRIAAVVVAGFGAWAEAQLNATTYVAQLAAMLDELAAAVSRGDIASDVAIIFRPAPYTCCASMLAHRYGSKRGGMLTSLYQRAARAAFPRALWWDTRALSEARPLAEVRRQTQECSTNHLNTRLVHQDARVLMHLLCVAADARPTP